MATVPSSMAETRVIPPLDRTTRDITHDVSRTNAHVKSIPDLCIRINGAFAGSYPAVGRSRYKDVFVLLVSWADDDLGVITEINELNDVFRNVYRYRTEPWSIPSTKSYHALSRRILDAVDEFDSNDKLFIVYYGGHGYIDEHRQHVWLCNQQSRAPTILWSSIQTSLLECGADVLILLDSCSAASSAGVTGSSFTEVMAACGFEQPAPPVGDHSFTRHLIEELRFYGLRQRLISSGHLYNKILTRAMNSWNPRLARDQGYPHYPTDETDEKRKTPIHAHLKRESIQGCIMIAPLPLPMVPRDLSLSHTPSTTGSSAPSTSLSEDTDMLDASDSSQSLSSEIWPDPEFQYPKVLVSVAIEEECSYDAEEWIAWFRSIPASVECVQVEAIFKSNSTLLLLSLPVAVWDMLPEDPAMSFIAFTKSHNLLTVQRPVLEPKSKKIDDVSVVSKLWHLAKTFAVLGKGVYGLIDRSRTYLESVTPLLELGPTHRHSASEFIMVIHLPASALQSEFAQTVCVIDAVSDVDLISDEVVESLSLQKEKYQGPPLFPSLGGKEPEWQVTFDWHVHNLQKTFTSTFAVLEVQQSFDVLLGGETIQKLGSYKIDDRMRFFRKLR